MQWSSWNFELHDFFVRWPLLRMLLLCKLGIHVLYFGYCIKECAPNGGMSFYRMYVCSLQHLHICFILWVCAYVCECIHLFIFCDVAVNCVTLWSGYVDPDLKCTNMRTVSDKYTYSLAVGCFSVEMGMVRMLERIVDCLHYWSAEIPSVDQGHIFCHFCKNWIVMHYV
jgi:hypothetical protein